MFKKLLSAVATTVLTVSMIFTPVHAETKAANLPHIPSKQAATAFVGDLGSFRKTARKVARENGAEYDLLEIGVVVNGYGDTVIFPDAAYDGVPSYAVVHKANVKRGQVYALAEKLDGSGEVDDIDYYLVNGGKYTRTDELCIQFKAAWGEWPNYGKRRATETNIR